MNKQDFLILKSKYVRTIKSNFEIKGNGRSADYIIPNFAIGCVAQCLFCYQARNTELGNPLTLFTNVNRIVEKVISHHSTLRKPKIPNQCDNNYFTYDIGESSDVLGYPLVNYSNYIIDNLTKEDIKPTFATKLASESNIKRLIDVEENKARIRVTLTTKYLIDKLELGTTKLEDRIKGAELALKKGYEVHFNFSPVIVYTNWLKDYEELFKWISLNTSRYLKQQLKCEVIFLTHSESLHLKNIVWSKEEESILWTPENQELKINNRNSEVLRYKIELKKEYIKQFKELLKVYLPYCPIRYIF